MPTLVKGPERRALKFLAAKKIKLPELEKISVHKSGWKNPVIDTSGVGSVSNYGEEIRLPSADKFDVWWHGKIGTGVRMIGEISLKEAKVMEIHVDEYLAIVRVTGTGLPKLERLYVGHPDTFGGFYPRVVQEDDRFGREMVVPKGTYELHMKPAVGPRRLLESKLVVAAGTVVEVD